MLLHSDHEFISSTTGETYEMRNNLVVRPFKTHHVIPSQVCLLCHYSNFVQPTNRENFEYECFDH